MNDIPTIDDLHVRAEQMILVDTVHDCLVDYSERVHIFNACYSQASIAYLPGALDSCGTKCDKPTSLSLPAIVFSERVKPQRIMAQLWRIGRFPAAGRWRD